MVDCGRENEVLWKAAVLEKEKQIESMNKWLGSSSGIFSSILNGDTVV